MCDDLKSENVVRLTGMLDGQVRFFSHGVATLVLNSKSFAPGFYTKSPRSNYERVMVEVHGCAIPKVTQIKHGDIVRITSGQLVLRDMKVKGMKKPDMKMVVVVTHSSGLTKVETTKKAVQEA